MNLQASSSFTKWFERLSTTLTEVVFPPVCGGCGRLGTILCDECVARMMLVEGQLCHCCGRALPDDTPNFTELCTACAAERPLLRQVRAPFLYAEPTSHLIHRLKYDGYFALARPLAALMAAYWPQWETPPDVILPIPLHKRRKRRRGFNQSALLAKGLAAQVGVACDESALLRHRYTDPQTKLGPQERRANVAGAFIADTARVAGRHVVLIDDVYTTGSTMSAAAEALQQAGAASSSGYCLARVG